jgi:hypothetical protein
MLGNFITVGTQVLILFILIAIGYISGKTKIINDQGISGITNIVLYAVTPCVVINAFQREYNPSMLTGLIIALAMAALSIFINILMAKVVMKFIKADEKVKRVWEFSIIFSNCGYMSLPLQQAVLQSDGVFYGAAFIAVFNVILWSYGLVLMSGGEEKLSVKNIVLNPGIIGTVIGLALYLLQITLPEVIATPVEHMAALNTPLPMIIIGYFLSKTNITDVLKGGEKYIIIVLRLIISPLIILAIMYSAGIRGALLVSTVISASAPVATATTLFATKFGGDEEASVEMVSLSTLLSIISMTLIVGFTENMGM